MKILIATWVLFVLANQVEAKSGHHHRSHGAHVHGEGELKLVTEGPVLVVELTLPGSDIVGFEHRPSTPEQVAAIEAAVQKLRTTSEVLKLPAKAGCLDQGAAEVTSDLLGGAKPKEGSGHQHADFKVTYKMQCQQPENLNQVEVSLFTSFPKLKSINAQGVTGTGPSSQKLTSKSRIFKLGK